MRAHWVARSIVTSGKGLKNKWVCRACSKSCNATLPLNEEPDSNCNGGYEDERPKGHSR